MQADDTFRAGDTERAEPTPGMDVQLTIDRDIQFIAERAIRAKVTESAAESGTVVVMDPRTGRVLALATYPSFDPAAPLGRRRRTAAIAR